MRLHLLSRPRRARRPHEWSDAAAVTFIVTLAARGSVTLAARAAGMSRKSAYALQARDPVFARAWQAATRARRAPSQGDKVDEVDGPRVARTKGDTRRWPKTAIPAAADFRSGRQWQELWRDEFFARLRRRTAAAPSRTHK